MNRVYLDHNATTAVEPDVLDAMLPFLSGEFGNAASIHTFGQRARAAVETAREQVAALIGALTDPECRAQAATALGHMGADAKEALPLLTKLKLDEDKAVREAAAAAINQISE